MEAGEVSANIQRKAVHGNPTARADADAGQLAAGGGPDPRLARIALRRDAESVAAHHDSFLKGAEISMEVLPVAGEIQDRIADQLAGAVPGGLAAATDLDEGSREVGGIAEAGAVRGTADGEDGIVLEQEEGVRRIACEMPGHDFLLEREALGVINTPEPAEGWGGQSRLVWSSGRHLLSKEPSSIVAMENALSIPTR